MRGWEWHLIRCTAPAKGFCQLRTADGKGSRATCNNGPVLVVANPRYHACSQKLTSVPLERSAERNDAR